MPLRNSPAATEALECGSHLNRSATHQSNSAKRSKTLSSKLYRPQHNRFTQNTHFLIFRRKISMRSYIFYFKNENINVPSIMESITNSAETRRSIDLSNLPPTRPAQAPAPARHIYTPPPEDAIYTAHSNTYPCRSAVPSIHSGGTRYPTPTLYKASSPTHRPCSAAQAARGPVK